MSYLLSRSCFMFVLLNLVSVYMNKFPYLYESNLILYIGRKYNEAGLSTGQAGLSTGQKVSQASIGISLCYIYLVDHVCVCVA